MTNLSKAVATLQGEYSRLQRELDRVGKALAALGSANGSSRRGKRILSKEARERIAEAQRQRWAKVRKAKQSK